LYLSTEKRDKYKKNDFGDMRSLNENNNDDDDRIVRLAENLAYALGVSYSDISYEGGDEFVAMNDGTFQCYMTREDAEKAAIDWLCDDFRVNNEIWEMSDKNLYEYLLKSDETDFYEKFFEDDLEVFRHKHKNEDSSMEEFDNRFDEMMFLDEYDDEDKYMEHIREERLRKCHRIYKDYFFDTMQRRSEQELRHIVDDYELFDVKRYVTDYVKDSQLKDILAVDSKEIELLGGGLAYKQ